MSETGFLRISEEVAQAANEGRPLVALESSVISQGLPRPVNLQAAIDCETEARSQGATPATIAVLDGSVHVGLGPADLERLATQDGIEKAGARDLGRAVAQGRTMATTVGATVTVAHASGIRVIATGGIGGVHRGFDLTGDVSHDLHALASTPVVIVSAGFKSILDLPRTLEYVESLGITLVGFETNKLPDFYSAESGFAVESVDAVEVAGILRSQAEIGLKNGVIVANPPPADLAFGTDELQVMVSSAADAAERSGVSGKALTPFLLARIAQLSDGRSVQLNVALLKSNVRVAAQIATSLAST